MPFTRGLTGGQNTNCYSIQGGFGGGGTPHCHNGAGGGGYTGGWGGTNHQYYGEGGGSFVATEAVSITDNGTVTLDAKVEITKIK
jgi:hypothetical protein